VLIGVTLSMASFGTRLTIMTFFGVIALGGMVVNNAIVLVDFTNRRRRDGLEVREAILDAAKVRLKPILITTLTTLLGLVPLAFAIGEGSEIYAPMGQVIGGGLITSTLITLGHCSGSL
jgi:HAE1 family hydrophobic/amphiphilic exporter-1